VDVSTAGRRRRRLTVVLAAAGLLAAVFGGVYAQLADASRPHFDAVVGIALMILCPPSLIRPSYRRRAGIPWVSRLRGSWSQW
jgi:hypothetical protein